MENGIKKRIIQNREYDGNTVCEFPKNMLIEPTNICNHSCLMCANSKGTRKRGVIDKGLAKRILKEAYDLGTREVGFYGMGEPLLDENLEDHIAYAKSLGYEYVYITTNGALLSETRAETLMNAGIDSIKFSINAATPKDYLLIHGKDDFDKVIKNLICLDNMRKKQKRKIAIYISFIVTRYTESDKELFRKKYQNYADDIIFFDCKGAGDMIDEVGKYLSVSQNSMDFDRNFICPMVFNKLHVTYEGYLTMCCDDLQNYLAVADLNEESLKEAWNNQSAQGLRKRHLEHNLEGTRCYNCINGCNEKISPLRPELAMAYDVEKWNKEHEIKERIDIWKKKL